MMDFRRVDISKQKAYDLLRDWIKLVARHTNPDQDISELLGWLWKLKPATPDPATGLMPCGCGGKAKVHQAYDGTWCVQCGKCAMTTLYRTVKDTCATDWNRAMGVDG